MNNDKKKKKFAKTSILILISLLIFIWIVYFINIKMADIQISKNETALKNMILSLDENVNIVKLNEITPFEWDKVYFFNAYTGNKYIYDILGFKWHGIKTALSEGIMQVIFVKNNKVICYCHGYGSTEGYNLYCDFDDNINYRVFYSEDYPTFNISKGYNSINIVYI